MVRIVCWNINRSADACAELEKMDADVALLQEVGKGAARRLAEMTGNGRIWNWDLSDAWPAVVRLSDRVKVDAFAPIALESGGLEQDTIGMSDQRTLAAARVTPLRSGKRSSGRPFFVFSMYARWLDTHPWAQHETPERGGRPFRIYSDASAHRIISDLSTFIGHTNPSAHRMLVAGDLNTIYGAMANNRLEKPARARTIFDRMQALGLELKGPRWPEADRQADPLPQGLPRDTSNVPTYLSAPQRRRMREEGILSGNQLDYVFASQGFQDRVRVYAMNDEVGFGPSDHCRIRIEVQ